MRGTHFALPLISTFVLAPRNNDDDDDYDDGDDDNNDDDGDEADDHGDGDEADDDGDEDDDALHYSCCFLQGSLIFSAVTEEVCLQLGSHMRVCLCLRVRLCASHGICVNACVFIVSSLVLFRI